MILETDLKCCAGGEGYTQTQAGSMWAAAGSDSDQEPEASEHHEDPLSCLVGGHRQGGPVRGAAVLDDRGVL